MIADYNLHFAVSTSTVATPALFSPVRTFTFCFVALELLTPLFMSIA